jgi:hypothetical protein
VGACIFFTRVSGAGSYSRTYVVNNIQYPSNSGITADSGVIVSNNYAGNAISFASYVQYGGAGNDLHLTSSDSALIGQARDMSTYFTTDKDGNQRPSGAWDIAAYQFLSGGGSLSPPTGLAAFVQ